MLSAALGTVYDGGRGIISPERMAAVLRVTLGDVARIAQIHRNTLARTPGSAKVQARLGEIVRILADAQDLLDGDLDKAVLWFHHQPLVGFGGETAEELVATGHGDAVLRHLQMLRDGGYA